MPHSRGADVHRSCAGSPIGQFGRSWRKAGSTSGSPLFRTNRLAAAESRSVFRVEQRSLLPATVWLDPFGTAAMGHLFPVNFLVSRDCCLAGCLLRQARAREHEGAFDHIFAIETRGTSILELFIFCRCKEPNHIDPCSNVRSSGFRCGALSARTRNRSVATLFRRYMKCEISTYVRALDASLQQVPRFKILGHGF